MKALLLLVFMLLAGQAEATTVVNTVNGVGYVVSYLSGGAGTITTAGSSMITPSGNLLTLSGDAITGRTSAALAVRADVAGASTAMSLARGIGWGGAARMAGKALGGAVAGVVLLPLATALYEQIRCRVKVGDITKAVCDEGEPEVTQECMGYNMGWLPAPGNTTCSAQVWCNGRASTAGPANHPTWGGFFGELSGSGSALVCSVKGVRPDGVTDDALSPTTMGVGELLTETGCRLGSGKSPIDAKCKSDVLTTGSWDDAANRIVSAGGGVYDGAGASGHWDPAAVIDESLKRFVDPEPYYETDPASLTGPATVAGTPTTTNTPAQNGNPAQSTTQTPTTNITYQGNHFSFTSSVVTSNSTGGTTTTTTTTGPATTPQPTDCDKIPDSLGCTKLGTPPTAENVPNTDVAIGYTPVPFASTAGCPSPVPLTFTIANYTYANGISWQPMCDALGFLRPLTLVLAAAFASLIFYEGLQRVGSG